MIPSGEKSKFSDCSFSNVICFQVFFLLDDSKLNIYKTQHLRTTFKAFGKLMKHFRTNRFIKRRINTFFTYSHFWVRLFPVLAENKGADVKTNNLMTAAVS